MDSIPHFQLGAHGIKGKGLLLEEATRVPLIMSFPGKIPANRIVGEPVSHIDIFATILDYLGASAHDRSDGKSLSRFIEKKSENRYHDEEYAVVEIDGRRPTSRTTLSGKLGGAPRFSIRKGRWVLILPSKASSPNLDMMYNMHYDPYQQRNVLGNKGKTALPYIIGKAEHLKILLLEHLQRNNRNGYYSDPKFQGNEGRGDITEIR